MVYVVLNERVDEKSAFPSVSTSLQSGTFGHTNFFLERLNLAAYRNGMRNPGGYRYDSDIKSFATYLRLLSGPQAYNTI